MLVYDEGEIGIDSIITFSKYQQDENGNDEIKSLINDYACKNIEKCQLE